jgi:hypothetical protein
MSIPNPQDIRYGSQLRKELMSNPETFASDEGVSQIPASGDLDKKHQKRMAGPGGAFAIAMMDPTRAMQTNKWMEQFGMSNQGQQFNQAKQMQANQAAGVV